MNSFKTAKYLVQKWFANSSDSGFATKKDEVEEEMAHISEAKIVEDMESLLHLDTNAAWERLKSKIETVENKQTRVVAMPKLSWFPYAAAIILVCGLALAIKYRLSTNTGIETTPIVENPSIALYVEGKAIEVSLNKDFEFKDVNGGYIAKEKNGELVYHKTEKPIEVVQHQLQVPYGKKATVVLSDGTKVYCDAGTTLTYPSYFEIGKTREVKLQGQGYFDVAKQGADQFMVQTNTINVSVLGTQFNVAALPESKNTDVVLVEGLVRVIAPSKGGNSQSKMLVPNQKITYNNDLKNMHITQVNPYDHTAWISGRLIFKGVRFHTILRTLERRFNVAIVNKNEKLNTKIFRAKFDNESLEQILNAFKENESFTYSRKGNTITIQ